jgi:hypothetical protein
MRQLSLSLRATLVACALGATALSAVAQTAHDDSVVGKAVAKKQQSEIAKGDPARWHRVENSNQARLGIQKKEAAAAYAEAKNACRQGDASGRNKCMKDAQVAYQHDLSRAPQLVAKGPTREVLMQVSPLQEGATAVGGSSTSATESGGGVPDIGQNVPREYRPLGKDNGQPTGTSEEAGKEGGTAGQSGGSQSGSTTVGAPTETNGSDATRPVAPPPDMPPPGKPTEQH